MASLADKRHSVFFNDPCKITVFGEKTVTRMNRIGASERRRGKDGWNIEIALRGRRRANAHAFVGQANMHGVGIGD